jgi:two-component system, OmpR family, copper resistance phosphate regulon response regulator CusR
MKVLIVEDDVVLAGFLREGLSEEGHVVSVEHDGISGELAAQSGEHDAIVLDVMIPEKSGFAVLSSLRKSGFRTPVLMLTARDTAADAITGLDGGADDYLRKPFAFGELLARLRSITRREPSPPRLELRVEDVVLDLATRRVTRAGAEIQMTAREVAYLEYFMRNAGLLITRNMIEAALWTDDAEVTSNVIDVYVRRLRRKLTNDSRPSLLHTVRGAGYRFGL